MSANYNLFYFFKQFPDETLAGSILKNAGGVKLLSVRIAAVRKRFTDTKTERHSSAHTAKSNFR